MIFKYMSFILALALSNAYDLAPLSVPRKTVLFFPVQVSYCDPLPVDLYTCFSSCIENSNVNFQLSSGNVEQDIALLTESINRNESITLLSHSTGINNLMKVCDFDPIEHVVLVDPILLKKSSDRFVFDGDWEDTISEFIESNKFDMVKSTLFGDKKNRKTDPTFGSSNKLTYISSKKSARWKIIPPVPPVKRFLMDYNNIKHKNKKFVSIPEYGHFDILDQKWADAIHNSISKGSKNRDDVCKYHQEIAHIVNE